MPSATLTIEHELGLHARPAAEFVKRAASFPCTIKVRKSGNTGDYVDAKSILSVMTLAVTQGDDIEVVAEGAQAEAAIGELRQLVESNFRGL
jgi:phosphocarrier protein HPr